MHWIQEIAITDHNEFARRAVEWLALLTANRQQSPHGPCRDTFGGARKNYERYLALAREAALMGDTVEMENCYHHAEHYFQGDARRGQVKRSRKLDGERRTERQVVPLPRGCCDWFPL
jgi:hypothetical protein